MSSHDNKLQAYIWVHYLYHIQFEMTTNFTNVLVAFHTTTEQFETLEHIFPSILASNYDSDF